MISTVNEAFSYFLTNTVNLDASQTTIARSSRDNLIDNIEGIASGDDFFNIYSKHNLKYGSFARHTKIRQLDDIDLMICFSASSGNEQRTYKESLDCIRIMGVGFDSKYNLLSPGTSYLNSTKVINRVISKLGDLRDYSMADMHKNQEAATLKLKSYSWNFDIVPCFYTDSGLYLIPDGSGNWKKTDPRIDIERTQRINQRHKGKILDVIRLMKFWNERKVTIRMDSYMLECMILTEYERLEVKENYWVDLELRNMFLMLSDAICNSVPDPKGFQGDLNTLSWEERQKIRVALIEAYKKAKYASSIESTDQRAAINKWREVLGPYFPQYTE